MGTTVNRMTLYNTPFKVVPFIPTPTIATLVVNLDAGNISSYPGSGTTWTDLSGNGNNVVFSASAAPPQFINSGNASFFYNLGGANYARTTGNANNIPLGSSAWSVSVWASTGPEGYSPSASIMGWGQYPAMNTTASGGTNGVFMGGYGQNNPIITGSTGAIINIVFTNDPSGGATGKIGYKNSVVQASGSYQAMSSTPDKLTVMANNNLTPWNGRVYIVRMWNYVLSQTEVTAEWDTYRGRYGL